MGLPAKPKILLGVCGSIAAYRSVDFLKSLLAEGYEVQVVLTQAAEKFVTRASLETFLGYPCIDNNPFDSSYTGTDHIRWARWADLIVIYGATANRLSVMATGGGGDMLSLQWLAFKGPILIAPAMNPAMWKHPIVQNNFLLLKKHGVIFCGPENGTVACGETGVGHLASHDNILKQVASMLYKKVPSNNSKRVLVSFGPMRSKLDPVRYLQNKSSGLTGILLVQELLKKGYQVTALVGPIDKSLEELEDAKIHRFETPKDYEEALDQLFPQCDIFISAAAVLDFEFESSARKLEISKNNPRLNISLKPVPDFVAKYSKHRRADQKVMAFALQTGSKDQQVSNAHRKLKEKECDFLILNSAEEGLGPEEASGEYMLLLANDSLSLVWGKLSKEEFASQVVKFLLQVSNASAQ